MPHDHQPDPVHPANLDYLDHLARESRRFAEILKDAAPTAKVPTCPDWDADDLLWHLAEVQWYWGTIAREQLQSPDGVEERKPKRPESREELEAFFDEASAELLDVLTSTPPETVIWTWAENDQTGAFIRRRQAHEALIHRLDAELTVGSRTPLDPALAADGVDEVVRVMYGGAPPWGSFTPSPGETLRLSTSDTGQTFVITLGRFVGTHPGSGKDYDQPDVRVAATDDGSPVAAEISATAADLNCWLWNRPPLGPVERSGDAAVLAVFDGMVDEGID